MWNKSHGDALGKHISDNQFKTATEVDFEKELFWFTFYLSGKSGVEHRVEFSFDEVKTKFEGSLAKATAHWEFVGYLQFKEKFRNSVKYDMGEMDNENVIQKKVVGKQGDVNLL